MRNPLLETSNVTTTAATVEVEAWALGSILLVALFSNVVRDIFDSFKKLAGIVTRSAGRTNLVHHFLSVFEICNSLFVIVFGLIQVFEIASVRIKHVIVLLKFILMIFELRAMFTEQIVHFGQVCLMLTVLILMVSKLVCMSNAFGFKSFDSLNKVIINATVGICAFLGWARTRRIISLNNWSTSLTVAISVTKSINNKLLVGLLLSQILNGCLKCIKWVGQVEQIVQVKWEIVLHVQYGVSVFLTCLHM